MVNNEMREYQNILVEILKAFSRFCKKKDLTFFMVGGTLLGSVRHKGFIPWDDDIDLLMPRKDYEKLVKICKKKQPDGYFLQEGRTYAKYWHIYAKFRKNGSYKFENNPPRFYPKEHRGINIDIFPLDYVSSNDIIKKIQFFLLEQIRCIVYLKRGYKIKGIHFMLILRKFLAIIIPFKLLHWFSRVLMTLHKNESKYCISWGGIYGYKKEAHLYTNIFPLAELEFESERYCAPRNWDAYLKKIYGDYMELPPFEERKISPPKYQLFSDEKIDI